MRRRLRAAARLTGITATLFWAEAIAAPAPPGYESLNLFQMTARSDLVVRARVREGALRYAIVDIVETIRGTPPADRLRIAFRHFNWTRGGGAEPLVFHDGTESILFLVPFREVQRTEKNRDLYELANGLQGRIELPAEGSGPIREAIRRLAEIASLDPQTQIDRLHAFLRDANPWLLDAALDETLRLRAAVPAQYGDLIRLLSSPAERRRTGALRLIAQVFGLRGGVADARPDEADQALAAALERARNDGVEEVRVAAVAAVAAWPDRRHTAKELEAIARLDKAQAVRYEAQRALLTPRPPL